MSSPSSPRVPSAGRVDLVLAGGLALLAGAAWATAPLPAIGVVVTVAIGAARAWRIGLAILVVALAAAGAARASAALARYEGARRDLVQRFHGPALCEGTARIAGSPSRRGDVVQVELAPIELACEGPGAIEGPVGLWVDADVGVGLGRGDVIEVSAQLAPRERFLVAEIDGRGRDAARGVPLSGSARWTRVVERGRGLGAAVDRARSFVRARIEATFTPDTAPLARALVLGENDVSDADATAFKESGLVHLLAVSGMHLVLVVATLVRAIRALLARVPALAAGGVDVGRWAAAVGVPIAWIYADFAGGSGSARRAAIMTGLALAATALGRRLGAARALGWSIGAVWVVEPLCVYDASFSLSVCATGGLVALGRPLEALLRARLRLPRALASPLAATTAATAACAPVTLGMSRSLPLGGVVANLVAVPIGEVVALPLCLAHAALSPLPPVERGVAVVGGGALRALAWVARVAASAEWAKAPLPPPTPAQIALLAAAAGIAWIGGRPRRVALVAAAGLVALELAARREGAPIGELRVTFLDVGQGDAALIDLPDGQAMLVDGGGLVGSPIDTGARVIAPVLRARRRRELAVVALSHPHPDHYGGLPAAIEGVKVVEAWDSGEAAARGLAGGHAAWLAAARRSGAILRTPPDLCGLHAIGGTVVEVLAPCPGPHDDEGANDNSLVIRIAWRGRSVLFVGDLERAGEERLLAGDRAAIRSEILKVGHHGSRTSTSPAMLAAVAPLHAVVSTGVRNRFGHPHPVTLATLSAAGVPLLRTDRGGAIVARTRGGPWSLRPADP